MKREEAVSILKEIMLSCNSFYSAQAVSISKDTETQGWILSAKWVRPDSEITCLDSITLAHNAEIKEIVGHTIFSKPNLTR